MRRSLLRLCYASSTSFVPCIVCPTFRPHLSFLSSSVLHVILICRSPRRLCYTSPSSVRVVHALLVFIVYTDCVVASRSRSLSFTWTSLSVVLVVCRSRSPVLHPLLSSTVVTVVVFFCRILLSSSSSSFSVTFVIILFLSHLCHHSLSSSSSCSSSSSSFPVVFVIILSFVVVVFVFVAAMSLPNDEVVLDFGAEAEIERENRKKFQHPVVVTFHLVFR